MNGFWFPKEQALREALHSMGLESDRAKLPLPPSSLKTIPLQVPDCFHDVAAHLAQCPPPFVGLQVLPILQTPNRKLNFHKNQPGSFWGMFIQRAFNIYIGMAPRRKS